MIIAGIVDALRGVLPLQKGLPRRKMKRSNGGLLRPQTRQQLQEGRQSYLASYISSMQGMSVCMTLNVDLADNVSTLCTRIKCLRAEHLGSAAAA